MPMNKAAHAAIGYRFRTASSSAISPLTRQLRAMQRQADRQTERGRYDGPTGAEGGSALLFSQFWHCRRHNRFYRVIAAAVTVCLSGTATFSTADHTRPLVVTRNVGFCRDHKPPTTAKKSTVAPVKMRKAYKIPKYDHCKKASPSSGKQW